MSQALAPVRILITRPEPQASRLAAVLEQAGANTLKRPLLAIEPIPETAAARRPLLDLDQYDQVIVTSAPAAELGMAWIENCWPQLPLGLHWWAIGAATAAVLAGFGLNADYAQEGHDSEALLEQPALRAVQGQRILLLTGAGGRGLITETLRARGAEVTELALYRRTCPHYAAGTLATELDRFGCNWILATSGQVLNNLLEYLAADRCTAQLLVPSERVRQQALAAGFSRVALSRGAGDQAIVDALREAVQRI